PRSTAVAASPLPPPKLTTSPKARSSVLTVRCPRCDATTTPTFFSSTRRPPTSTLFPYTTLFRSRPAGPGTRHARGRGGHARGARSEEHTSELQSRFDLVCRLLLEKKKSSAGLVCFAVERAMRVHRGIFADVSRVRLDSLLIASVG